jgi:HEAT repeat protein
MTCLLDDDDAIIRKNAIEAIARVGGPGSIEILAEKLNDPSYDSTFEYWDDIRHRSVSMVKTRSYIALCLALSGRTEAIPALRKATGTADEEVSASANWALVELGGALRPGSEIDPEGHPLDY